MRDLRRGSFVLAALGAWSGAGCTVGGEGPAEPAEVSATVEAGPDTLAELGVARWKVVAAPADGAAEEMVRVVGLTEGGGEAGELTFGLSYDEASGHRVSVRFDGAAMVLRPGEGGEIESNTLAGSDASRWLRAASVDLDDGRREGGCGRAVVVAGATCAGAFVACDDGVVACAAGGLL
jgi:hypothetical protein